MEVSIIIPVYNAEKTLVKCMESVLSQTFSDFEIILINDGSKDNSINIMTYYEEKYPNIVVIDKCNEGASVTRNIGMDIAKGKYLIFIDSDDYIDPDYVETLYKEITTNQLDIVISGIKMVDSQGKIKNITKLGETEWSRYVVTSPCTRIFKKHFLEEHNLRFLDYTMEDIHFNAVAFSKTEKIKTIPYVGYNNFINMASTTRTSHRGITSKIDLLYLFSQMNNELEPTELVTFLYKKVYIYYLLYSGRYSSADRFINEHKRIKSWVTQHHLVSLLSPFDKMVREEKLKNKLVIYIFERLERLHLINLFAKLYCKK
ncbi:glycosyltransferase family 2 protein [Streptococcus dysgalactiae]|uniref:Cell-wall biogenesis glycosyltransferase n=1 Tax=Streptococcus dysgalactiae TaxID=1334 RepID=A0A9X9QQK1_STRDY|nr:glycosyltransferase [Streptococcus dysgalactiae]MDY2963491.1 glycosyltransferase [Streptococcus dysgalactiae]MDY4034544.1 glycosyltransferase [Streptococcus dysgalactiae]MEC4577140.1 glycosyltransferase [Streptococcus dysgalactiae]VTS29077.1 cell-wall biogenesis glycosyltransferase [Streptococcus dysgalactiae subsp. equisimilis]VTS35709.1 cell-wall biogenesis glycosyltransferase [Streptococcus dysgalactiae subsp. equisimilis]